MWAQTKMADQLPGSVDVDCKLKNDKEKLNFSEQRSKIRLESTLTENLRKSLQSCKASENEEKLEGLAVFFRKTLSKLEFWKVCCTFLDSFWHRMMDLKHLDISRIMTPMVYFVVSWKEK